MDKRKRIAIIVSVLLTAGFYFMYTNSIIYWDAYAYEVYPTDTIDPEYIIEVTSQDLAEYPAVIEVLDEAETDGWAMATFEDGSLYEFNDFFESQNEEMEAGYVYLQYEGIDFMISYTTYGGMEDDPLYMGLTYLAAFVAIVLILSEALAYFKARN